MPTGVQFWRLLEQAVPATARCWPAAGDNHERQRLQLPAPGKAGNIWLLGEPLRDRLRDPFRSRPASEMPNLTYVISVPYSTAGAADSRPGRSQRRSDRCRP